MSPVTHFDIAIVGAGSGNMISNASFADRSVAIIEHNLFGGTCLNVGCIPTKMFVYPADLARNARHAPELGVHSRVDSVDWPAIRDRIFGRIDPIPVAGKAWRQSLPNHTVYDGHARFTGVRTLSVTDPAGGPDQELTADQIVVAAGSRATVPDIPGLAEAPFHTSDTIMRLEKLPERLVIIGGGVIAAEFAHVFSAYNSHVTQIVRGEHLLSGQDDDVSRRFTEIASRQWDVRLHRHAVRVDAQEEGITLELDDGDVVDGDVLLVATGRVPNSDRLAVAAGGIETDDDGVIVVDEFQRTSADGVWALGDVANHFQLKHVANHEARVIQHNLLHPEDLVASMHTAVPAAVFTSPQIAVVGLTEEQARADGTPYVSAIQDYGDVAYGWAMEDRDHFVKLIARPGTGELLGGHIIGPQASLLLQPIVQAMSSGLSVHDMARNQYWIHPSLAEVVENALLKLRI